MSLVAVNGNKPLCQAEELLLRAKATSKQNLDSNIFSVQKLRFKYLFSNPSKGSTSHLHRQSSD